jgi:acyl-CoA synthetase (AMP-forming)/AMP-acid ligase II/3-hydroxymyristoyl/3-hydroxydecanoyl-(acyl carrier protein) dehydratase
VSDIASSLTLQRWWQRSVAGADELRLRNNALHIAGALRRQAAQRIALHFDAADEFLPALLGCLLAQKTVVLLPNLQPDFVAGVRAGFDVLLSDRACDGAQDIAQLLPHSPLSACEEQNVDALRDGRLQIFTSGSTGEPKRIDKTLAQLEAEVSALQTLWGDEIGDAVIVSTVSHQHIYGLLFRVLWPLLSRRRVVAQNFQYPEPLLQQLLALPQAVLVTSPAQLKRMPELVDMTVLADGRLCAVFSSGGRLDNRSALAVLQATGTAVTEVLGSTETGGVAWRRQLSEFDRALWQPLPGVAVGIGDEEALQVISPFIGNVGGAPFVMGDRARLDASGSFDLLDRVDSIVKVEGKRVALAEIGARLTASPLVDDASAVLLQGQRDSIGAIVVLSATGRAQLAQDKRALNAALRAWLADYFEAVVLPKKWRYVDALPVNAQGKTTQRELQALFLQLFQDKPQPRLPQVLSQHAEGDELRLQLLIPPDLFYFEGHFPERPILPGVVQIGWALHFGKLHLGADLPFKALEAIKFQSFVVPSQTVELQLSWSAQKHKLTFSYQSGKGAHSSGRIVLAPVAEAGVPA